MRDTAPLAEQQSDCMLENSEQNLPRRWDFSTIYDQMFKEHVKLLKRLEHNNQIGTQLSTIKALC